jgi:bifunctional non-homologous end joining protein LigD
MPDETVIDGEIVALDEEGRPSFNTLQNYGSSTAPVLYYVFDVPVLAGRNLMREPLGSPSPARTFSCNSPRRKPIRQSPELNGSLRDLISAVQEQGL